MPVLQSHPFDSMEIELVYSGNIFRTNSCPWSRLTVAEQKKKRNYACGNNFYRSQQHRSVTLGPRKACHNTYEKVISSCGGVDIVLESSSAGYRHPWLLASPVTVKSRHVVGRESSTFSLSLASEFHERYLSLRFRSQTKKK